MSDHEGHGHKAVVYKSHFPPLRHSVVTETPADTLAYKRHLHTKTLFVLYAPMTMTMKLLMLTVVLILQHGQMKLLSQALNLSDIWTSRKLT